MAPAAMPGQRLSEDRPGGNPLWSCPGLFRPPIVFENRIGPISCVELSKLAVPVLLTSTRAGTSRAMERAMADAKKPACLDPLDYETARRLADEIAKMVGKFVLVTDKYGRAVYEAEPPRRDEPVPVTKH